MGVCVSGGYNAPMQIGQWEQRAMSWQTLGGRFLAAAGQARNAKIINTIAVVLFAGTLAHWTWGVLVPARRTAVARVATRRVTTPPLAMLLRAHLFGRSATTSLAAIPVSHLALTLSGLVLGARPLALIGQAGQGVRPYLVGATVSPGVVLAAVTRDRAILRQEGRLESLLLYPPKAGSMVTQAQPAPGSTATETPSSAVSANVGSRPSTTIPVTAATMAKLSQVSTAELQASLAPAPEGGVLVKGAPGKGFAALGLRPGDVVEEINGRPVNSLGSAISAYMAGAKAGGITVDVARHGQIKVFRYALPGQ